MERLTSVSMPNASSVVIDTCNGVGIALSKQAVRARCCALGLKNYQYSGHLESVLPRDLEQTSLTAAPGLLGLWSEKGQHLAHFKRYEADVLLTEPEFELASYLFDTGPAVRTMLEELTPTDVIEGLCKKKVISYI